MNKAAHTLFLLKDDSSFATALSKNLKKFQTKFKNEYELTIHSFSVPTVKFFKNHSKAEFFNLFWNKLHNIAKQHDQIKNIRIAFIGMGDNQFWSLYFSRIYYAPFFLYTNEEKASTPELMLAATQNRLPRWISKKIYDIHMKIIQLNNAVSENEIPSLPFIEFKYKENEDSEDENKFEENIKSILEKCKNFYKSELDKISSV
jgi:hypothetical protein